MSVNITGHPRRPVWFIVTRVAITALFMFFIVGFAGYQIGYKDGEEAGKMHGRIDCLIGGGK